ncbi:MAG TPA: NADH-quinone oxidoreductase subunit N, partial [Chloroflexia bacterium]|nr:NADH-quinone oxidoreductase subunit N [Chloroflexia bacterium]
MPPKIIVGAPDFNTIVPELIITVLAIVLLIAELVVPVRRKQMLTGISVLGYGLALVACFLYFVQPGLPIHSVSGMVVLDQLGLWFRVLALLSALIGTVFAANYIEEKGMPLGDFYAILALSTLGMMVVSAAHDLTVVFVGIELSSIATYIMTGFNRGSKLSNEGALKYFLLGTFATAILVYGMAWLYGMTGSTNIPLIANQARTLVAGNQAGAGGLLLATLLLIAGLGFKVAAVPFHMWTPDAYQGAPTPVTAIMSVGPKAAGFAAIVRILVEGLGPAWQQWVPVVAVIAVLTMTLGNIIGLSQRSVKRMLAYSSIAHTGYILVALASYNPGLVTQANVGNQAIGSMLFYLFAYVFMIMGAFGLVIWMERNGGTEYLDDFRGLSTWAPLPAAAMLLLMLSLAGIPPTIGFLGKYYVFLAAVNANLTWLAVIGVINSAIGTFYYLRVIWYMYFEAPQNTLVVRRGPLVAGG